MSQSTPELQSSPLTGADKFDVVATEVDQAVEDVALAATGLRELLVAKDSNGEHVSHPKRVLKAILATMYPATAGATYYYGEELEPGWQRHDELNEEDQAKATRLLLTSIAADVSFIIGVLAYTALTANYQNIDPLLFRDHFQAEHVIAARLLYNIAAQTAWKAPDIISTIKQRLSPRKAV